MGYADNYAKVFGHTWDDQAAAMKAFADAGVRASDILAAASAIKNGTVAKRRFNLEDFGLTADARQTTDAVTTAASAVVTSANAAFVAADIGKHICITGDVAMTDGVATKVSTAFSSANAAFVAADQYREISSTFTADAAFIDASGTGGSSIVLSATALFTADDEGKTVTITEAGAAGATYTGTISSYRGGNAVSVSPNITTTISGQTITIQARKLFPAGTFIATVTSPTDIVLSQAAQCAGTGITFTINQRRAFGPSAVVQYYDSPTQVRVNTTAAQTVSGGSLTVATDNLPAFNAVAALVSSTKGATILCDTPGEYWVSDTIVLDAERVTVRLASGAHIFTTDTTTVGATLNFTGNGNLGAVSTPVRDYAEVIGGKITGWLGGRNENAIGWVRYRSMRAERVQVEAGRKGITSQFGGSYLSIVDSEVVQSKDRGVSIEDQAGASVTDIRNLIVTEAGAEGIFKGAGDTRMDGVKVVIAFTKTARTTSSAVAVSSGGGTYQVSLNKVRVVQPSSGNGVSVSTNVGHTSLRSVTADTARAGMAKLSLFNHTGVWSSSDSSTVTKSGTTVSGSEMAVDGGAGVRWPQYTTAGRPSAATAGVGAVYYDTTLSKPGFSDGTAWRDSAGTAI